MAFLLGVAACDEGAANVLIEPLRPDVLVEVGGGLAGADYAYAHTAQGVLVGVRCQALCDFEPGDTLHTLSLLQSELLQTTIDETGVWDPPGSRDFGVPCCDQFEYRLTFSDGPRERVVRGTTESFPEPYARFVRMLEGLRRGIAPIHVWGDPRAEGYPYDPVEILSTRLEAPILVLQVRYAGGCAWHDLDLVAVSGWRESYPVQVDVDLAHDDHDDPCDALPTREVRFDLTPLREAYEASYGPGPGAVALHLGAASGGARSVVTWSF